MLIWPLLQLTKLGSRELVDNWVTDFVMMRHNTRGNRARLVEALFSQSTVYTDLYPYYGRLVATLDAALKGFAAPLVEALAGDCF